MTLYYIYFGILLLSTIVGIARLNKMNRSSKFMLLLLLLTLLSESIATYLRFSRINNVFLYHIFMPVEFFILGYAFYSELKNRWAITMVVGVVIYTIFNSIFIQNFNKEFGSYAFVVQCIFSTILGLWYLKELLDEKKEVGFYAYPMFWISLGFTIFNIINLFLLGTLNTIGIKIPNINLIFRNIRFFSNYLLYTFFIFAFLSKQEYLKEKREV